MYVCPLSQSTAVLLPSQPVEQSPQSVVTLPLPHDRVKSKLAPGSNKLLPAATMTAVPVSGDQSNEYSAYVLPDSDSAGILLLFMYNSYLILIFLFLKVVMCSLNKVGLSSVIIKERQ